MAVRESQVEVDVLYTPTDQSARVSQVEVDVLYAPTDQQIRVSQIVVDVLYAVAAPPPLEPRTLVVVS
jgi:hypothetical protein